MLCVVERGERREQGTVDAALCLMNKIEGGSKQTLFNMIEVLESGDMA